MGKTATTFDARNKHNLPVVNSQGGTSTFNAPIHAFVFTDKTDFFFDPA